MRKVLIVCLVIFGFIFVFRPQISIGEEKESLSVDTLELTEKSDDAVEEDDFYKEIELFTDALTLIRSDYVEDTKYKELIYGALKGMLSSLDPYSQFLDPEAYTEVKVETEGEFGGLGIEITVKDGILTIISPIDDTPAFNVGLKADDKIVKIEGELTRDITLMGAVKKLRGKPGTDVAITVMREGAGKLLDFTITRDIIKIKSIRKAKVFENNIGYIRLSEFQERSPQDLEEALRKLEKEGMDALVLDLRNNPGGLLDSAVKVAEKFIPAGKVIVSTRGRLGRQNMVFRSSLRTEHREYPLIVLISKGSASGSEIIAGAIKDYKRGMLLGTKTFGKGSVQTVVPLGDGSALRLTTSKYFTPNGICIHEEGIEPDVEVEFKDTGELDVKEESEKVFETIEEEIDKEDKKESKKKEDKKESKKKEENGITTTLEDYMKEQGYHDNQLVRAVDLLKGIKFYKEQKKDTLLQTLSN